VEGGPGKRPVLVHVLVVRTPAGDDIAHRLLAVAQRVEAVMDQYRPDTVAIERVFSQSNVRTVMGTAQAAGVVALAAARRGIPVAWHTPSEVKAAVSGNGNADKAQVGMMVTRLLRLAATPKPADAADALALAICHLWRSPMQAKLAAALARPAVLAPGGGTVPSVPGGTVSSVPGGTVSSVPGGTVSSVPGGTLSSVAVGKGRMDR